MANSGAEPNGLGSMSLRTGERIGDLLWCLGARAMFAVLESAAPEGGFHQVAEVQETHAAIVRSLMSALSPYRALTVLGYRLHGQGYTIRPLFLMYSMAWLFYLCLPVPLFMTWLLDHVILGVLYWQGVDGMFPALIFYALGVPAAGMEYATWKIAFICAFLRLIWSLSSLVLSRYTMGASILFLASQLVRLGLGGVEAVSRAMTPQSDVANIDAFWATIWAAIGASANTTVGAVNATVAAVDATAAATTTAAPEAAGFWADLAGEWVAEVGSDAVNAVPGVLATAAAYLGWLERLF